MRNDENYIVSNQIRCNKCGDEPFSMSVHDFKSCNCGAVAADGGQDYLRRVGNRDDWVDMSITINKQALEALLPEVEEAMNSGRNPLGVTLALLRAIRDIGLTPDRSYDGFIHWDKSS